MDYTEFLRVYKKEERELLKLTPCDLCGMDEGTTLIFYAPLRRFVLMCDLCASFYGSADEREW